ncbi:hypothetical protein [Streptomyces sp. NPDC008001]|uniref:hypothetical protein n=1 Tax=Streptomyces sp. NPDC008001 TaxID=3364804 RepID=UPI0036E4D77F
MRIRITRRRLTRNPGAGPGLAVLASAAGLVALAQPPAAAAGSPAGKGVPWSTHHGTATASGTRRTERDGSALFPALVVRGELKNTGTGCYSVWVQWTYDFAGMPPRKHVTQCGPATKPVDYRLPSYSLTTTGSIFVCKGDKDTSDCGPRESLTSWPVGTPRTGRQ